MKKESIFCIGKVTGESLVLFWRKLYYVPSTSHECNCIDIFKCRALDRPSMLMPLKYISLP